MLTFSLSTSKKFTSSPHHNKVKIYEQHLNKFQAATPDKEQTYVLIFILSRIPSYTGTSARQLCKLISAEG